MAVAHIRALASTREAPAHLFQISCGGEVRTRSNDTNGDKHACDCATKAPGAKAILGPNVTLAAQGNEHKKKKTQAMSALTLA